jgi:hypothetical protein
MLVGRSEVFTRRTTETTKFRFPLVFLCGPCGAEPIWEVSLVDPAPLGDSLDSSDYFINSRLSAITAIPPTRPSKLSCGFP